jgi:hypothetical protein
MSSEKETLQRVQSGLYHLRRGLAPFVEARMKGRHGASWLHHASRAAGGSPNAAAIDRASYLGSREIQIDAGLGSVLDEREHCLLNFA